MGQVHTYAENVLNQSIDSTPGTPTDLIAGPSASVDTIIGRANAAVAIVTAVTVDAENQVRLVLEEADEVGGPYTEVQASQNGDLSQPCNYWGLNDSVYGAGSDESLVVTDSQLIVDDGTNGVVLAVGAAVVGEYLGTKQFFRLSAVAYLASTGLPGGTGAITANVSSGQTAARVDPMIGNVGDNS